MKEHEFSKKSKATAKRSDSPTRLPSLEHLSIMKTEELVRLFHSPKLARPVNAPLRQKIIRILQQREGNAFIQRLLREPPDDDDRREEAQK